MPQPARTEVVVPKQLDAAARARLIDDLYEVHADVFDGVDKPSFVKYVVDSKAEHTWLMLHKSPEGRIVGYFALHFFERALRGVPSVVVRAEAGTLRAWRGGNTNARFGIERGLAYLLRNLRKPMFYLGSLVHPSSYTLFCKYFDEVYPSAGRTIPPDLLAFMSDLADSFGLERVDPANPLVRAVGWRTRDTEVERSYWQGSDKPSVRFFLGENPGYGEGHGLVTMVPVSAAAMARMIARVASARIERQSTALLARVEQLPVGAQLIKPWDVRRRLAHVPLLAGIGEPHLGRIARAADVRSLGAGSYVFREGDVCRDMYLVASGAVYVLVDQEGQETVIDEMPAGAIFGEIAMLSGEQRTASIRTATTTTLVRIGRDALDPVMAGDPQVRDTVWRTFAERRFLAFARGTHRFEHISPAQRQAWVRDGRHEDLAAGVTIATDGDAYVFLLTGAVELSRGGGTWLASRAPALVEIEPGMSLVTRSPARVVHLGRQR